MRREGTSEGGPEAVRQAVGGGCQSGRKRLLSVTNTKVAFAERGTVAGHRLGALEGERTWTAPMDPTQAIAEGENGRGAGSQRPNKSLWT